MAQRRSGSTFTFVGALLLGAAIFALVMVVMGTRLDRDFSPAPATSLEVERQDIAALAHSVSHANDAELAAFGTAWSQALGGVWVSWPSGAPAGYTNPPTPSVPAGEVHETLRQLADRALGSSLGPVATSMGISSLTLGAETDEQCGAVDLATVARALNTGVAVTNIETARQWLEWQAASLPPADRKAPLTRVDELSNLIDGQLSAGAPDTRPAIAPEPADANHTASAYRVLVNQLAFSATSADTSGRRAIASFVCHLHKYADAPAIDALPGITADK
ncbi:hypothetical protein [Trueperella pecoris]|uniref:hypothetical protein n=1 Tax=Trueperella pecoris TaxID=2733571 RepID=UPI00186B9F97|nr:hypothetical protein [Trueperella pecoris]QOQ39070.1 hypothetical protein HLG82_06190 [Trueperella pecoris]